jgi:hypothetical protein
MRNVGEKSTLVIVVRCLRCRHRCVIAEGDLVRFAVRDAPVVQFVKDYAAVNAAAIASWQNELLLKASPDLKTVLPPSNTYWVHSAQSGLR